MEGLIYSVIVILSVLVIICLVKLLTSAFFFEKNRLLCIFTIIPVKEKEDIEYTVRSVLWSKNWERYSGQHILLVVSDCDDETKEICEKLCDEYEPVSMCRPDELEGIIKNPESILNVCL